MRSERHIRLHDTISTFEGAAVTAEKAVIISSTTSDFEDGIGTRSFPIIFNSRASKGMIQPKLSASVPPDFHGNNSLTLKVKKRKKTMTSVQLHPKTDMHVYFHWDLTKVGSL